MLPWLALGAFILIALAIDLRHGSSGPPSMPGRVMTQPARETCPVDGARSSVPPGRRTRGASASSASRHVNGSRFARAQSSISIVAFDRCGPMISMPTPSTP